MAILNAKFDLDLSGLDGLKTVAKRRAVTLKGVRAAGKVVAAAARSKAPKRAAGGGTLRRSIGLKAEKGKKGKTLAFVVIGARKRTQKAGVKTPYGGTVTAVPAYYAHLVEKGTRPHATLKGSRLARRGKKAGGQGVARTQHPGAKAQPFLRPAYESTKDAAGKAATAAIGAALQAEIAKQAQKLAGKGRKK